MILRLPSVSFIRLHASLGCRRMGMQPSTDSSSLSWRVGYRACCGFYICRYHAGVITGPVVGPVDGVPTQGHVPSVVALYRTRSIISIRAVRSAPAYAW